MTAAPLWSDLVDDLFVPEARWRPAVARLQIPATDGFSLAATLITPVGTPRTPVVIASATGVKRRYYEHFASFLAEQGHPTILFDYRGIGGSRPSSLRGFDARMRHWGERDLAGVIAWARQRFDETPHFVGHSVGGQLLGLAEGAEHIRAAVTIGSQSGYWGHWPSASRYRIAALWYGVIPAVTRTVGYFPGSIGVGEDLPAGVALEWATWGRHPAYLAGLDRARCDRYARLDARILAFAFPDDEFAPLPAVKALHELYAGSSTELREIDPTSLALGPIGHFGFFRDRFHATLWPQVSQWFSSV